VSIRFWLSYNATTAHFSPLLAFGLFVVASLVDAVFAMYTVSVVKTQAFRAGALSLFTYVLEAFAVVSYIDNKVYLAPLALGAFVGSYGVVKWEDNKKKRPAQNKK